MDDVNESMCTKALCEMAHPSPLQYRFPVVGGQLGSNNKHASEAQIYLIALNFVTSFARAQDRKGKNNFSPSRS